MSHLLSHKASSSRAMQADDIAYDHDDHDTDSLFGSPPPSPGRGRSPSPLALPSGQDMSQNVGTLALPGSHLCSELPPALLSAPPVAVVPRPRPPPLSQIRQPTQDRLTTLARNANSRIASGSSRKKKPSRRSTPVVDSPPIQLPSPDEPLPPNFLRNQDALLGRAGLVAGVRPADLAFQRDTRGQSSSNPIVVEDEVDQPLIGRRPLANRVPPYALRSPSHEEIIQSLVKQKNLVPVLHALLRVVTGSAQLGPYPPQSLATTSYAPSPASTSTSYPYYPPTYTYPYGHYYPSAQSSDPSTSTQSTYAHSRAPKRRRLSTVPAGASDWDVPYPFAEGQGPPNYRTNWEKERGRQLVEDLVSLVKCAARKAAVKKVVDGVTSSDTKQESLEYEGYPIGSVEYYRERVLSHCRPQMYGYESGRFSYPNWSTPSGPSSTTLAPPISRARASTTSAMNSQVTPTATSSIEPSVTAQVKTAASPPSAGQRSASVLPLEPIADSAVVGQPMLPTLEERCQSEPPLPSACQPLVSPPSEIAPENPQDSIDDFLSFINNLPSGDLDALFSTDFSSTPADESGSAGSEPAQSIAVNNDINLLFDLDPDAFAIDPALLALPGPEDLATSRGSDSAELANIADDNSSTPTQALPAPPTPTLVGSPVSLSDLDPPTPRWDFTFPEPEIVGGSGSVANDVNPSVASEGIVPERDEAQDSGTKDKGKGRALEGHLMDVDPAMHRVSSLGSTTPSAWQSEPTTASTSVVTSRQSTPGPFIMPPAGTPAPPPPSLPSGQSETTSAQPVPWPRTSYAHHLPPFLNLPPQDVASSRLFKPTTAVTRAKPIDREDVINRARAMRAQIVGEIERAKVELWETTMEGGCLSTLSKDLDKMVEQWNQSRRGHADGAATGVA